MQINSHSAAAHSSPFKLPLAHFTQLKESTYGMDILEFRSGSIDYIDPLDTEQRVESLLIIILENERL